MPDNFAHTFSLQRVFEGCGSAIASWLALNENHLAQRLLVRNTEMNAALYYFLQSSLFMSLVILFWSGGRISVHIYSAFQKQSTQRRCEKKLIDSLPGQLLQISAFLASGHALTSALTSLSTSEEEKHFNRLLQQPTLSPSTPQLQMYITMLRISFSLSKHYGYPLSPQLKKIADVISSDCYAAEKLNTLTLPLRMQAYVSIAIPWAALLFFYALDPTLITTAATSHYGWVGFLTAFVLECVGILWIRRILS